MISLTAVRFKMSVFEEKEKMVSRKIPSELGKSLMASSMGLEPSL